MKKYTNILVALGVTLFLLTVGIKSEAKGACPPGSTSSITTTFTVRGCDFKVTICWKCGVTSSPLVFGITSFEPIGTCFPPIRTMEAQDSVINQLLTPPWLYLFCFTNVKECSEGTTTVIVRKYSCFNKFTPSFVPPNPQAPTRWEVCSFDSYCQNVYELCLAYLGNLQKNGIWLDTSWNS